MSLAAGYAHLETLSPKLANRGNGEDDYSDNDADETLKRCYSVSMAEKGEQSE